MARRRPGGLNPHEQADEWRRADERDTPRLERSEKLHCVLIRRAELGEIETQRSRRVADYALEMGDALALQLAREAHDLDPGFLVDGDAKCHGCRSRSADGEAMMAPIAYLTPNGAGKISAVAKSGAETTGFCPCDDYLAALRVLATRIIEPLNLHDMS